jgi:DNA polymerase-3 subunit epsilon
MDFGLIVDVETTGLDPKTDKIIEIGLVEFAVGEGVDPTITGMYSGLEDPGGPIPPKVVEITGIGDRVVQGRAIDWALVKSYFDRASVVIAHKMSFDRAFLRRRPELGGLEEVQWACSLKHIAWDRLGFKSRSLTYLAADHGFLNPFAHRALFDCATTFRLIAPRLNELLDAAAQREFRVLAKGSPFETKDKLRERGYRWDSETRVWWRDLLESYLPEERQWLAQEIYAGRKPTHEEVEKVDDPDRTE